MNFPMTGGTGSMESSGSSVPMPEAASNTPLPTQSSGGSEPTVEAAAPVDASDASLSDVSVEGSTLDAAGCDGGLTSCNAMCVNIQTDPTNCGGCSQACDPGAMCVAGTCACAVGQTLCSKRCVDLTQDPTNCHDCGHSCQGGLCTASVCQPSVVVAQTAVVDIAVDSTNVYWTTGGVPGNVVTKPFTGGNASLISAQNAEDNPRGIARDQNHVYWVDLDNGAVEGVTLLSGTPIQSFYFRMPIVGPTPGPNDIVVDKNNVYWVDQAAGTVNQQALASPGGTTTVLASGRNQPRALAVDATYVYWVDYGDTNTGSVNKVPIGGTNTQVVALATGENEPYDIVVDAEGAYVYWTTHADRLSGGSVRRVTTAGNVAPTVLANMQGAPDGIAIDPLPNEEFVYWTAYDDGTVMKIPVAGGTPFQMATNQNNPTAIAVDTDNVYWASEGNGAIVKVAK
jgi:sugar lactone lactonase YvrE